MKTSDLKVGDILHDVHYELAGNTRMRREGHWTCKVVAVADDGTWADISWNGNKPRRHYNTTTYKRWPKEWIKGDPFSGRGRVCGICRGYENDGGHKPTCEHPRAKSARKRTAKK